MRNTLFATLHKLMSADPHLVLLITDVGEYAAREIARDYPDRFYNLGISEQAIIGVAAGMAKAGMIPVVYGIAPFIVERAYEQIKLDIGHNHCRVILVTVGATKDYDFEGPTHQCPYDLQILKYIPNLRLVAPESCAELTVSIIQAINREDATYIRL